MTKIPKYGSSMLNCLLFSILLSFSCNHKIENKMNVSHLYRLIGEYEPAKEYEYYKLKQHYPSGDSLNSFFEKINPNEIMNDTNFRKPILYLLEKKYLYISNSSSVKNTFNTNNATNWGGERTYMQYALNIFSKVPISIGENYDDYTNKLRDVVCIDLIVNETSTYNLTDEAHKKIHNDCVQLMPSNCSE